ncbi:MAG: glucokinase [Coriobacteriales bacterium]|nr:glucokinase [Coriobacteriales bacterium]
MNDVLLAIDIGGTHTRFRMARLTALGIEPHPVHPETETETIGDASRLLDWIAEGSSRVGADEEPVRAVVAFAGPVSDANSLRLTNWPGAESVTLEELVEAGLPKGVTALVNDMVAGAYGLVREIEVTRMQGNPFVPLYDPEGSTAEPALPTGNIVYVAPGTGLGAAGLVRVPSARAFRYVPVASEAQHTPAPEIDAEGTRVLDWIAAHRRKASPSWEDVVSGRGLRDVYAALGGDAERAATVAQIAAGGVSGRDKIARTALGVYYRYAGRFAQMMALAFQGSGGLFLGGTSTRHNLPFIPESGFVEAFLDNPSMGDLLRQFPVYALCDDVNIEGALYLAAHAELVGE